MTTPTITELALAARRRLAATGWRVDTLDEITEGNGTAKEIVLRHCERPGRLIVRTHRDGSVTITAEHAPADWATMIAILLADLSDFGHAYPAEGGDRQ